MALARKSHRVYSFCIGFPTIVLLLLLEFYAFIFLYHRSNAITSNEPNDGLTSGSGSGSGVGSAQY